MSKHTPGPWDLVSSQTDDLFDFDVPWDGYGYPSLRTVAEFGETKSEVIDGQTYSSRSLPQWILDAEPLQHGNDEANARLIAAAPDLLAMLVEAHDIIDAIGQPETAEVAGRMRATIAKAEGES